MKLVWGHEKSQTEKETTIILIKKTLFNSNKIINWFLLNRLLRKRANITNCCMN